MLHRLSVELGYVSRYGATDTTDDKPSYVTISSGVMTFSTGIFLTLVRLYEPLFRVIILQNIYQFFGKIYELNFSDSSSVAELEAQDQAIQKEVEDEKKRIIEEEERRKYLKKEAKRKRRELEIRKKEIAKLEKMKKIQEQKMQEKI